MRTPIALAAALMTTVLAPSPGHAQTPLQQRGEVLARGMCSGCHAIGRTGDSPLAAAPRFRSLDDQTDLGKLARRLREGLLTGHQAMPMFRFDHEDADAMVAYLRTIQGR